MIFRRTSGSSRLRTIDFFTVLVSDRRRLFFASLRSHRWVVSRHGGEAYAISPLPPESGIGRQPFAVG